MAKKNFAVQVRQTMRDHDCDRDRAREILGLPPARNRPRKPKPGVTLPMTARQNAKLRRAPCGHLIVTDYCYECVAEQNKYIKRRV